MDSVSPLGYIKPYTGGIVDESNFRISKVPIEAKDVITKDYFDAKVPLAHPFLSYINLQPKEVNGVDEILDRPTRVDLTWSVTKEFKFPFNAVNFLDSKIELKEDGKTFRFLSEGTVSIQGSVTLQLSESQTPSRAMSFFVGDMRLPPVTFLGSDETLRMPILGAFKVSANQEIVFSIRWPYGLPDGESLKVLDEYSGFTLVYYREK